MPSLSVHNRLFKYIDKKFPHLFWIKGWSHPLPPHILHIIWKNEVIPSGMQPLQIPTEPGKKGMLHMFLTVTMLVLFIQYHNIPSY